MWSHSLYREVVEIESSPEPEPPVVGIGRQPSTNNLNTGSERPRRVEDAAHQSSLAQIGESQVTSKFPVEQQPDGQTVLPVSTGPQSQAARAVYEDPIEAQKKIMRQTRELNIKRRQEEEVREEAAREERIRLKLEPQASVGQPILPFGAAFTPQRVSLTAASYPQSNSVVMYSFTAPGVGLPAGSVLRPLGPPPKPFTFIPPVQHQPKPNGVAIHSTQLGIASQPPPTSHEGLAGPPGAHNPPMGSVRGDEESSPITLTSENANVKAGNPTGTFRGNFCGGQTTVASPPHTISPPQSLNSLRDSGSFRPRIASTPHPPIQISNPNTGHRIVSAPGSLHRDRRNNGSTNRDVELPFGLENSVLCTIQSLLEGALFDFAKELVPSILQRTRWETQEHGELNNWKAALNSCQTEVILALRSIKATLTYPKFSQILTRLHELRHIAVHRRQIGTYGVKRFIPDAMQLIFCLRDYNRHKKLQVIEWAVWRPEDVELKVELTRPQQDFAHMDVPHRDTFVRWDEVCDFWRPPGCRTNTIFPPYNGRGQPAREVQHTESTDIETGSRKRRRSVSPDLQPHDLQISKRQKRLRVKNEAQTKDIVDLTEEDKPQVSNQNSADQPPKDVIDLTEED